ncbi:MAG: type II toxin-antitoxin system MqsA family antitoxin [Planctomycetes bacterium]|nr:type II toxin-antitoxin system MqsA family antitoxin [Planctomycetota bacterium]
MKKITRCFFCNGGPVVKGKTDHISQMDGQLLEIKDVPCEVCQQCGEKYFDPKTIRRIEQIVKSKTNVKEYIQLPVYSYV